MLFANQLSQVGEHSFVFESEVGQLEGRVLIPSTTTVPYIAVLGHPHSLQGGTMNNKVVTTLARTLKDVGIPSLRFNFRGVENSAGVFAEGIGESEDLLVLTKLWAETYPQSRFIFAGFSFGSYVTYRAASQYEHSLLISIAPPVHHYNYHEFSPQPKAWHIIQGDEDEVVPAQTVIAFASQAKPPIPISHFAQTGHFFHGKLIELKAELITIINNQICLK